MSPSLSSGPAAPLIQLDQAHVIRGQVRVLHGLSLAIAQGQHTALLGPNGCGKSSFIKLITRELYPLARGDGLPAVQVLGQSRWQVDRLRSQLGIVSGDLEDALADQHGLDALAAVVSGFFASHVIPGHKQVSDDMRDQALAALAQVGAQALAERPYAQLSAGQRRRVLIARALVNKPQALLLDEPSSGLDVVARQHLLDALSQLARQGITLLLVTHHIEEVIPEIERVLLMRDGRILADGPRQTVLQDGPLSAAFDAPLHIHQHDGQLQVRVLPLSA
ncbi:ABC transporter ATP-binding protein [Stenotrophomonas ginsengisoli]|uniref:ABC transporter ATP-binding protein n=1 Tax=Stenotrophomonas ginsengisoli TaxID=336566 RepID=A0A0R0DAF2_9GAMM|nr:ATP-binding cassette domain-containing protein [Stenotrophomonas ginsengisoli]KRG79308.1 ABC transporter ATP-binding protein [Stenotrophomonas ginsengisoli]